MFKRDQESKHFTQSMIKSILKFVDVDKVVMPESSNLNRSNSNTGVTFRTYTEYLVSLSNSVHIKFTGWPVQFWLIITYDDNPKHCLTVSQFLIANPRYIENPLVARLWDRDINWTCRGKTHVLIMTDGPPSYLGHFPTSIGYRPSVWDLTGYHRHNSSQEAALSSSSHHLSEIIIIIII